MQAADVLDEACEDEVRFGEEWERKIFNRLSFPFK